MRAGVPSAASRRRARTRGVGRHIARMSSTSSGIAMKRSRLISCSMTCGGKMRPSSSGVTGCPVAGLSGGASGAGRSGRTLYQRVGSSAAGSVITSPRGRAAGFVVVGRDIASIVVSPFSGNKKALRGPEGCGSKSRSSYEATRPPLSQGYHHQAAAATVRTAGANVMARGS